MTTNVGLSEPTNNAEMNALLIQKQDLSGRVDSWNTAYVYLGAIAALMTCLVLFVQFKLIREGKRLSHVQDLIIVAKELKATADSLEKDHQIALARQAAKVAEEHASALDKTAAALRKQASDADLATARLEAQIQPRRYTKAEEDRIALTLEPFAGRLVTIRSMPYDVEGAIFATSLARLLSSRTKLRLDTGGIGNNFIQNLPMFLDVRVVGPADEQNLVRALAEALSTPRVKVDPLGPPTRPGGSTTIFVGAKRLSEPTS